MKSGFAGLLFLVAFPLLVSSGGRRFNGYQVLTVGPITTDEQFQYLQSLEIENNEYDFWSSPNLNGVADIMTPLSDVPQLIEKLTELGLEWKVKIQDVGTLITNENVQLRRAPVSATTRAMGWTAYQRWSTIEPWILSLVTKYPKIATVSTIGQTYERRNIYMVKISTGLSTTGTNKKAVFIDGNIHAREWIAGATTTWILNELTSNNAKYQDVLGKVDFYIVPYVNIDGYEFSHTNNRMWRKTRSLNSGSNCRGCDPNRNFGFQFAGQSTSSDPCSDLYRGRAAFSESEARAIRDALKGIQASSKIGAYITIHSYGQKWLLPWGYSKGVYPADYNELLAAGRASVADIYAVNGVSYETGQGADVLYGVGGASDDYAKSQGIKHTVTAELRDRGNFGFLLPASEIIPTSREAWAGILRTTQIAMMS